MLNLQNSTSSIRAGNVWSAKQLLTFSRLSQVRILPSYLIIDPTARFPRAGFEGRVPVTPDDFARLWQQSPERVALLDEMEGHERKYPKGKEALDDFMEASKLRKSKHMPKKSPYTVTIWMQINACIVRAYQRMWGDKSTLVSTLMSNLIMSLVIGSVFYNTPENTSGFFSKVVISRGGTDIRLVSCFLVFYSMLSRL